MLFVETSNYSPHQKYYLVWLYLFLRTYLKKIQKNWFLELYIFRWRIFTTNSRTHLHRPEHWSNILRIYQLSPNWFSLAIFFKVMSDENAYIFFSRILKHSVKVFKAITTKTTVPQVLNRCVSIYADSVVPIVWNVGRSSFLKTQ